MAKNAAAEQALLDEQAQEQVMQQQPIPNDGPKCQATVKISIDSFFDEKTNETREFLSIKLVNPFPDDPDVPDFKLTTKWKNDSDLFKYRARKHLRTHDDFQIDGIIQPYTYFNKKYQKDVTYIGIFVPNPFVAEKTLELRVNGEGQQVLFSTLFRDFWNLHNITVEPVKDEE